jgi:hypothetical protein
MAGSSGAGAGSKKIIKLGLDRCPIISYISKILKILGVQIGRT